LAEECIKQRAMPERAQVDALHVAIATLAEVEYLVTWNCRHIARGEVLRRIPEINRRHGLHVPTICTPEELRRLCYLKANHSKGESPL
jgi:hypothetical protein